MYFTNYSTYIPLIAAVGEYHALANIDGIDDRIIFAEADGYPVEIVQPTTTIDELKMRHGD